jgi:hypothetical protein
MKLHRLCACLLGLLLGGLASTTAAQTLWRCGADGRLFSDRPCADGQAYTVTDRPSAADVQAATLVAERERRLAQQLADERRARAQAAGSGLIGIGPQLDDQPWARKPPRARADKTRQKAAQTGKFGRLQRDKHEADRSGGEHRVARSPAPADKDLKRPPRPQRPRSAAGT